MHQYSADISKSAHLKGNVVNEALIPIDFILRKNLGLELNADRLPFPQGCFLIQADHRTLSFSAISGESTKKFKKLSSFGTALA